MIVIEMEDESVAHQMRFIHTGRKHLICFTNATSEITSSVLTEDTSAQERNVRLLQPRLHSGWDVQTQFEQPQSGGDLSESLDLAAVWWRNRLCKHIINDPLVRWDSEAL